MPGKRHHGPGWSKIKRCAAKVKNVDSPYAVCTAAIHGKVKRRKAR